jgi:hypothetical protein
MSKFFKDKPEDDTAPAPEAVPEAAPEAAPEPAPEPTPAPPNKGY